MSKSKYINSIASEHSWRGYGPFYYNTMDILKQIPIHNSICDNKKISNRLVFIQKKKLQNIIRKMIYGVILTIMFMM